MSSVFETYVTSNMDRVKAGLRLLRSFAKIVRFILLYVMAVLLPNTRL